MTSYYTTCSMGVHKNGETDCVAPIKSQLVTTFVIDCSNPGSGGSGGTGPGYWDCPNPGQPPTGPVTPDDGMGTGECVWVPTDPNPGTPNQGGGVGTTPCEKTKNLLANAYVESSITELKNNATTGSGEKGFKVTKSGEPSPIIPGEAHSVNFGDKTGFAGGYHNHTKTGIPMLSPPDINELLGFARAQGNQGDTSQAFMGMVAPNGEHYIIRFTGTYQDAVNYNFMAENLEKLKDDYREKQKELLENSQYENTRVLDLI